MDAQLPASIDLEVVTPERRVVSASVQGVTLQGAGGELGILPGHAPLVTELSPGLLSWEENGSQRVLAASSGFAEVLPGRVIVLVETAEAPEEIDLERARAAMHRAADRLKKPVSSEEDMKEAAAAKDELARAAARLQAASKLPRAQGKESSAGAV
ncbi:MAG: F0F1 ATP synthase subunit epsilon [Acidobacteriota bacterium]|nr:F0F1 ATP synthase subunit epsilon [Acidobacteriota bacterium]